MNEQKERRGGLGRSKVEGGGYEGVIDNDVDDDVHCTCLGSLRRRFGEKKRQEEEVLPSLFIYRFHYCITPD